MASASSRLPANNIAPWKAHRSPSTLHLTVLRAASCDVQRSQGMTQPLVPRTFTDDSASVFIVVACPKADIIHGNTDLVDGGASGMGGIRMRVNLEEYTDGILQILRIICLKDGAGNSQPVPICSQTKNTQPV